jgi:hypothetical protein
VFNASVATAAADDFSSMLLDPPSVLASDPTLVTVAGKPLLAIYCWEHCSLVSYISCLSVSFEVSFFGFFFFFRFFLFLHVKQINTNIQLETVAS